MASCRTHAEDGTWMLARSYRGMEFKPRNELQQVQQREQPLELLSQAWLKAWPEAKMAAMGVEVNALKRWAEWWTQVEAKARGRAERRVVAPEMDWETEIEEARERVHAGALALAAVWIRAQGKAREMGKMPRASSSLADFVTVRCILSDHNRYGVAHDLWDRLPETRDEYSCIIHFIAPIARLPFELLRQIFLVIIDEARSSPSALMLVCKLWHTIVTSIWASINLGTRTPLDTVIKKVERNQWLLDIVIDTDSDRGDFTPSDSAFEALFAAIEAIPRWRHLVVKSSPAQADLPEDSVNRHLQRCTNATMSRFTTFKIKSACKTSPLLNGLLHILSTTAGPELTTMEINSANVILFLAHTYPSIFHFITFLSLNTPGIPNPVDLLPYLHQLETFTASHISFPIYHNDIELPFIHTLRHLSLRAVSIQWMHGRTFHILEDCTLIFPLHRHVIHTFNTTLPNCKHLTFQGSPFHILNGISTHKLIHFSVTCSGSFNQRGNQQLVQLSHRVFGESHLAPKVLHIGIEATNQAWISALSFMSDLEELVIESAGPSSLGAKVIRALIFRPVHASNPNARPTPVNWHAPLCPSLKRFGLKYRRWLRRSEEFNLIPDFEFVISSRGHSNYALQSFSIWMSSNQVHPLELIEGSQVSLAGLKRLGDKSEIFSLIPHGEGALNGGGAEMYWEENDISEQVVLGEQSTTLDSGHNDSENIRFRRHSR